MKLSILYIIVLCTIHVCKSTRVRYKGKYLDVVHEEAETEEVLRSNLQSRYPPFQRSLSTPAPMERKPPEIPNFSRRFISDKALNKRQLRRSKSLDHITEQVLKLYLPPTYKNDNQSITRNRIQKWNLAGLN